MENIKLFGNLHGMDKYVLRQRSAERVRQSDFSDAAGRRVKGYSGGMLRQLNLLMALISDPDIVFLDEPPVGMDARARRRTRVNYSIAEAIIKAGRVAQGGVAVHRVPPVPDYPGAIFARYYSHAP